MSAPRPIFTSAQLGVLDSRCSHPRAGPTAERGGEPAHLALLRRGTFSYHLDRRRFVGDACTALLHHPAAAYRVGHPGDVGDDATIIQLEPALMDELFGRRPPDQPELRLSPRTQLLHARLWAGWVEGRGDALEREEQILELLRSVACGDSRAEAPGGASGPHRRRTVSRARALLAANLSANLGLGALALEARCSPFHLMRLFRAETGRSLRAYRRELRVAAALPRLAEGEGDLARLALELGFSHHSHLSESFRRVLGVSPSRLRAELRGRARARS